LKKALSIILCIVIGMSALPSLSFGQDDKAGKKKPTRAEAREQRRAEREERRAERREKKEAAREARRNRNKSADQK